jgi:hypothetical protein
MVEIHLELVSSFFGEDLFDQVVYPDVSLGGDEQEGFGGVEEDALDQAFGFGEGQLGAPPADLTDENGAVEAVGHDGGEVVALAVPGYLGDLLEVLEHDSDPFAVQIRFDGVGPFDCGSDAFAHYGVGFRGRL